MRIGVVEGRVPFFSVPLSVGPGMSQTDFCLVEPAEARWEGPLKVMVLCVLGLCTREVQLMVAEGYSLELPLLSSSLQ